MCAPARWGAENSTTLVAITALSWQRPRDDLEALDACQAGYDVPAVVDASDDPSEMASRVSVARFVQGGVKPTSTNSVLSELHRTWARPEAAELANLYGLAAPKYAAGIESYVRAQQAAKEQA